MLNDQQLELTELLTNFINSSGKFFIVHGKAGTGKTFTIKKFFRDNNSYRVVLSAPTHAATKNIEEPGFEAKTLQSLLGLRPDFNLSKVDINNPMFKIDDTKQTINRYDVVVIDEYSMITNSLKHYLINNVTPKIIFIGDLSQLPPVESDTMEFNSDPDYELTKNMRSKTAIIAAVTDDIRLGTFNPNNYPELFKKQSEIDFSDAIVLSYTNDRVAKWNNFLKNKLNPSDDKFTKGDKIIFYDNVSLGTKTIANGSTFIVDNYNPVENIISIQNDYGYFNLNLLPEDRKEAFITECNKKITRINNLPSMVNKNNQWRLFFEWKNATLISENLYLNNKLIAKKQFDLAYAITIHKSQGQTFKNVVVDYKSLFGENYNELLYVAASRASESLTFVY